jgi:ABC-type amino acid transport system permease subunit
MALSGTQILPSVFSRAAPDVERPASPFRGLPGLWRPTVALLVGFYVELIRNTSLLVQIFIVYFGLSSLGLKLSAETSAVIALVVNMGAYTTEIMRALRVTRWQAAAFEDEFRPGSAAFVTSMMPNQAGQD